MKLQILHLGPVSGTCLDRANAYRRLGHAVEQIDLRRLLPKTPWVDRVTWRLGGNHFTPWILRRLPRLLDGRRYDLCHVENSEWVTPSVIRLLRGYCARVINYNIDDPLGKRDGARFLAYRLSVSSYDLCVVVRPENVTEAHARGARDVMRVFRSADEIAHAPRMLTAADRSRFEAQVQFMGTWFPERGPLLLRLIEQGVPLTIRGSSWNRAPEWSRLRPYYRGGPLLGDDYAKSIQCARVNIGLVSKGNRDLHTGRSIQIPALGGLLCAERTVEHRQLYEEGKEALFWGSADECAEVCRFALADEARRQSIVAAGHARLLSSGLYNEKVLEQILSRVMVLPAHSAPPDERFDSQPVSS